MGGAWDGGPEGPRHAPGSKPPHLGASVSSSTGEMEWGQFLATEAGLARGLALGGLPTGMCRPEPKGAGQTQHSRQTPLLCQETPLLPSELSRPGPQGTTATSIPPSACTPLLEGCPPPSSSGGKVQTVRSEGRPGSFRVVCDAPLPTDGGRWASRFLSLHCSYACDVGRPLKSDRKK